MGQYSFKKDEFEARKPVRAKYYRQPDGSLRLASIEIASRPIFTENGWEEEEDKKPGKRERTTDGETSEENRERSWRRASIRAMDIVACTHFQLFNTLTIDPKLYNSRDYHEVERMFSRWASNEVQRHGVSYIAVPEYHHDGEKIHLHMLSTEGLKLEDSGIKQHGKPVYNIKNWRAGFSTTQKITGEGADIACAKYIMKYMQKQTGQKIGGRYFLTGGQIKRPVYILADTPEEIATENDPLWSKKTDGAWGTYERRSYI